MTNPALEIKPLPIDELSHLLLVAKQREEEARQHRLKIESMMLEILPAKEEGTVNQLGQYYKATASFGMTRKITEPVALSRAINPELFEKLVRTKYELNTKTLKSLQDLDPETYKNVARFIETKPSKPSLKVEEIGGGK